MSFRLYHPSFLLALAVGSSSLLAAPNQQSGNGVPVSIIVTHETKNHKADPGLEAQDLRVQEGRDERPITSFAPASQAKPGVQLLIMLDDSARGSFGTQIPALKSFITSLPANVEVGLAYMRNGTTQLASKFTKDHSAAAAAVRLTLGPGGADVSPYDSLSDAIRDWPESPSVRREVIMISSGIEGLGGGYTTDNPYVNKGITDAQKAGVVVYAIYNPSSFSGRGFWRSTWGQNFLSQLADETGGDAFNINMGSPVSIDPYLREIIDQISHQYILTFEAKPENKGKMQPIRIRLKTKDGELAAPSQVFVKAGL